MPFADEKRPASHGCAHAVTLVERKDGSRVLHRRLTSHERALGVAAKKPGKQAPHSTLPSTTEIKPAGQSMHTG